MNLQIIEISMPRNDQVFNKLIHTNSFTNIKINNNLCTAALKYQTTTESRRQKQKVTVAKITLKTLPLLSKLSKQSGKESLTITTIQKKILRSWNKCNNSSTITSTKSSTTEITLGPKDSAEKTSMKETFKQASSSNPTLS